MVQNAEYIPFAQALAENRPSRFSQRSTKLAIDPDYVPTYEPPTAPAPEREPPPLRPPPSTRAPHATQSVLPPPLSVRTAPSMSSQSSPARSQPPPPPLSTHTRPYPGGPPPQTHGTTTTSQNEPPLRTLRSRTILNAAQPPPPSSHPTTTATSSRPVVQVPPFPLGVDASDYHREASYPPHSVHSPSPPMQHSVSSPAVTPGYHRQASHVSTSIHELTPPPQHAVSPPVNSPNYPRQPSHQSTSIHSLSPPIHDPFSSPDHRHYGSPSPASPSHASSPTPAELERSPSLQLPVHSSSYSVLRQNLSRTRRMGEQITAEAIRMETVTARLRRAISGVRQARDEYNSVVQPHLAVAGESSDSDGDEDPARDTPTHNVYLPWGPGEITDAAFHTSTPHPNAGPSRQFAAPPPRHTFPSSTHRPAPPSASTSAQQLPPPSQQAGPSAPRHSGPPPPSASAGASTRLYYRTPLSPYRGPRPPAPDVGSGESGDEDGDTE